MQEPEFLVQALGALSLVLWMTTRTFRLGHVADRRIFMATYTPGVAAIIRMAFRISATANSPDSLSTL
jgi:hypothetical protein